MSNINDTTFLQGMIDAAKLKKDQSQAVVDDHVTNSQAAIDAARAQISSLESQIAGYESDIADYNTQLENPPKVEVKDGKKTKMQVDTAEVDRITAERNASQDQLTAANTDVAAAQAEATAAEQTLAAGPDVVDPSYVEAQKMFGLLGHLNKIIALKTAGQTVSDAEMNTFQDNLTNLQTELADNMGAEFVTQFWTDVEAGIITLKDLGTVDGGDDGDDPIPDTGTATENIKNFYDAAVADESSTERQELNQVNELLLDKLIYIIAPNSTDDGPNPIRTNTFQSLFAELASITGDTAVEGDYDGYVGDLQELLTADGKDTYSTTAILNSEDLKDILNIVNQDSDSALLLNNTAGQKYVDKLRDIQEERADVLAQINEAYDTGADDQISTLLEKAHGLSQAFTVISKIVNGTDSTGGIDDPVVDLPIDAAAQVTYAADKQTAYNDQLGPLNESLQEWVGVTDNTGFAAFQRNHYQSQIDVVNEAKEFWSGREDFWTAYPDLIATVQDQEILTRINDYALQIASAEDDANSVYSTLDYSSVADAQLAVATTQISEFERRINLLVTNGSEGFVGPPEEEGIYNVIYNGLLPENIATQGPKIEALNTFLADKLMQATLSANNSGYTNPELLADIEGIMGEEFSNSVRDYLEHNFYDTDNTMDSVSAEALVKLMSVIKDYTGEVTYLSETNKTEIDSTLAKLDQVQALITTQTDALNNPTGDIIAPSLPEFLAEIASILGDDREVLGETDAIPPATIYGSYTGLTGAIEKGLAEYGVDDHMSPISIEELSSISDNILSVKELYDNLNITNIDVNRPDAAMNAYFYADEALETALLDRKSAYESLDDLGARIALVRSGESDESLEALTLEQNKYISFIEFTKSTEEFWSYEKSFSYKEQDEEALLTMYEQMRAQEEDFMTSTLGEVGVASSLTIADFGDKIEAINILKAGLAGLRGSTVDYGFPIPNPGFVDEASYASFKAETFAKESEELAAEKLALETALVEGHETLSPSQVQRQLAQVTLQKSITDFAKDFWVEENTFYQSLFKLDIPNDKADLLNNYLNQLSDLQRNIETWMGQLSSNNQSGRVARTKITRGRQQILGLKAQIRGLSL